MAQATATSTDELLSQLAASEIDRLLSEADAKGAPAPAAEPEPIVEKAEAPAAPVAEGNERSALLEAAGFEKAEEPKEAAAPAPLSAEDERSALLQAAGFESPDDIVPEPTPVANDELPAVDDGRVQFYLKPLVWMNIPFENCPLLVRQMLGRAGIVTLVNALAVLTYVLFFKKH
jgi:hypothetical protein